MVKLKNINVAELINKYDDNYIQSITLSNIKTAKELKALASELEKASYIVTRYYEMLYNDFIMYINNEGNQPQPCELDISNIVKYKNLASKIQKAYNYIESINLFNNPFKLKR